MFGPIQADKLLLLKLQFRIRKEWTAIAAELQNELPKEYPHSAKQVGSGDCATCRIRVSLNCRQHRSAFLFPRSDVVVHIRPHVH